VLLITPYRPTSQNLFSFNINYWNIIYLLLLGVTKTTPNPVIKNKA